MTGPVVASCTLRELVERFGGTCGGDLARTVRGFAPLDTATDQHLAFVTAASSCGFAAAGSG